jgi:transposase
MKIQLTAREKMGLELRHRSERDSRICDKIKSILLRDEGWSVSKIAQALRLSNDTVSRYLCDYIDTKNLEMRYQGSLEKLSAAQTEMLKVHLREQLYTKAIDIVGYVKETFTIDYTVAGLTDWLKRHDFSYKWTTGQPSKADPEKQKMFVEYYKDLKEKLPENEAIFFMDAVHPTLATKPARGWIAKGVEKIVPTTASRTRMNIMGAIQLSTMKVFYSEHDTINAQSVMVLCEQLKQAYSKTTTFHIILDQAGYHRSGELEK